jgi:hypothetical protein
MTKRAIPGRVEAVVRHAISDNGEFMLCGLAYDEPDDAGRELVQARPGQVVTCDNCRAVIDHVRTTFRRYRHVPNATLTGGKSRQKEVHE